MSVQSKQGKDLLSRAKADMDILEVAPEFAVSCNRGIDHCSKRPIYRSLLYLFVYLPECMRRLADAFVFKGALLVKCVLKGRR